MKYFLLLFCFGLILSSCHNSSSCNNDNSQDTGIVYSGVDELSVKGDSITFKHDTAFCAELVDNMKNVSDDDRTRSLANDVFWANDTLSRQQYVSFFNYLIDHEDSELEGPIADFIFEYFKDKSHFEEFDSYFQLYSDPSILEALTFEVLSSWSNENESISENDFKSKFEYLYNNGCLTYYKHFVSPEK